MSFRHNTCENHLEEVQGAATNSLSFKTHGRVFSLVSLTKAKLQRLQRNDRAFIMDLILKERRLRWYRHVERSNGAAKTTFDIQVAGKRGPAWEAQDDLEAADRQGLQRVEALGYRPS